MRTRSRREFLSQVGEGMLAATLGYGAAVELGLTALRADEPAPPRLSFGPREPLVALLQETPLERLMPALCGELGRGTSLRELLAAAALANARTFGGEDYIGFHTFMALAPAGEMAARLPSAQAALPVLKVLYRNSARIQEHGGTASEVLRPVPAPSESASAPVGLQLARAVNDHDLAAAEQLLAGRVAQSPDEAYNDLLELVAEGVEVHRTVLAYRAWDLVGLVGREHALTMLRQSLHYCATNCKPGYGERYAGIRALLPKLLDQYRLVEREPGTRAADDAWIESTCLALVGAAPDQAADLVAAALAEGFRPDDVGEAISLAANQLVLRDPGRLAKWAQPNKPEGSVHGDSIGVHASDSINAWRHISATSNRRNSLAALILAGWNVAQDRVSGNAEIAQLPARPAGDATERITSREPGTLLTELDGAIRNRDQEQACALAAVYGAAGHAAEPLFDLLVRHGVADDGALHAEKYFHTASEEFARTRPAFRWRQLVALARVTASQAGQPAPGLDEARRLLGA